MEYTVEAVQQQGMQFVVATGPHSITTDYPLKPDDVGIGPRKSAPCGRCSSPQHPLHLLSGSNRNPVEFAASQNRGLLFGPRLPQLAELQPRLVAGWTDCAERPIRLRSRRPSACRTLPS